MSFEITGTISEVFDTQEITASFSKREFVIEKTESGGTRTFTETIKFQLTNDRCDLIDPYTEGQEIKVHFNIKGRKWEKDGRTSYFTNLEAWRIEPIGEAPPKKIINQDPTDDFPEIKAEIPPEVEEDDLPF